MEGSSYDSSHSKLIGHRLGLVSIIGLWGFYFAVVTIRSVVMGYPGQSEMLIYRIVVISVAIGLDNP